MSDNAIARAKARIRAYVRSGAVARSRLCKDAGLDKAALRRMDRDDWDPSASTLEKLLALVPADFDERAAA